MKKLFIKCLMIVGAFVLLAPIVPAKAANTPVADQVVIADYYIQGGWKTYNETTGYDICQMFYPTKTKFVYFDLALSNTNPDAGSTWAEIRTNGLMHLPATVLGVYRQTNFVNYESAREMAHMDPQNGQEITLETNKGYWICITHLPQNAKIYYNDPTDYSGSLITGYSSSTVFHSTQSFGFRTYGYNPEVAPPADNSTPAVTTPSSTSTTSTSSTSGSAPSTNTSTSIAAPTATTAIYAPASQGVSINWTASKTTDITGYNIYRSTTIGTGYTKVGTVAKNVLQYVDTTVAKSTSYYYMVRAYKTTTESVNSNEAKVDVPADAVITTTVDNSKPATTIIENNRFNSSLFWTLIGADLVLLCLLALLIIRRKRNEKTKKHSAPSAPQPTETPQT